MIWTPTSIDMYMDKEAHPENGAYFHADLEPNDDSNYNRQKVFGQPNFIIANLAVGGNFPQIWDIKNVTALESGSRSMYIDWIRIYQRGDTGQSFYCPSPSDDIEPDNGTVGVEQTERDKETSRKLLRNRQLIIQRSGNNYDIIGRPIR